MPAPRSLEQISELPADLAADDAHQLVRVQRRSYAVEAALIGDDRIPQLRETVPELHSAGLSWWVIRDDASVIVGALAYRTVAGTLDIERLVVDPIAHRQGIATRLVRRALRAAAHVTVSTGALNLPARTLYEGVGFVHCGDREVLAGLWLSDYRYASQLASRRSTS